MLITLARKPLTGSVVQNCLQHGCGALNVDASRIGSGGEVLTGGGGKLWSHYRDETEERAVPRTNLGGRWPANVLHDGSEAVLAGMPISGGGFGKRGGRDESSVGNYGHGATMETVGFGDTGTAARFFKQIKGTNTP